MPVTEQEARAIAFIAARCRPSGVGHWDEAGIVAAVAKVKHLALPDVALAAIRAARDPSARTPGVISATGSIHWAERATTATRRDPFDPDVTCAVCEKRPEQHREDLWPEDARHEFVSITDERRRRGAEDASAREDARKRALAAARPKEDAR